MSKSKQATIEEKYEKLTQHEHILKRPNTYIGSIKKETVPMWVYNEKGEGSPIILKDITYVPGLYKVYDEILVNARDHIVRCIEDKATPCTMIKVNIDKESGKITVWNNGAGIDVVEHKKHKIMVPSMLFGELLTSRNYDDTQKRKVGGTNGFGAKLTNIYSVEFEVETLDAINNKKFYQRFTDNMKTIEKPKITSGKGKKPYTKISFTPDFEKFGIKGLSSDTIALFKKRVYDISMDAKTVKVYYNDEKLSADSFTKYVDLYFPDESEHKKVLDVSDENWKVCVVYDPTDKIEHQNISFVNGICTSRGGTHVDYVSNQIVNKLKASVAKRLKDVVIKPNMIKENLVFFISAVIVNPEFDTQTKEALKTRPVDFGSTYKAPESFLKKIAKTGVIDQIVANVQAKEEANLGKTGAKGKTMHFPKLYVAHKAGTKEGYKCTLILTEGDSAKTFAMAGLNVVGRDYYGVFPLRGKLLNVRDESPKKISENEEIKAITHIVGLEHKKVYNDLRGLRYGSIMLLCDSDYDGSHIKGLIMNFIHCFWPSLVKHEGFVQSFTTPLVKVHKGKGKNQQVAEFTNLQTFEEWKKENNEGKGWIIKYYKGLGTSTSKEAQECFTDLDEKIIKYYWQSKLEKRQAEIEGYEPKSKDICEDAITLAFAKKREDDRKAWLNTYQPDIYIDDAERKISYYDFVHKELIAFSVYDTARSIPNIMDGFKPGQRKVYYGSVKKDIYLHEIKVIQLSGYIAEHTHYHHGDQSLNDTIIRMAQNYVGSNNINLLTPNGEFGSRLLGGKDHASARYINTQLSMLGKKIFIDLDFDVLKQQFEDNDRIEPIFYAPIIPMILVNGSDGIGTGYSTNVKPCNPRDIYKNLKRLIAGEPLKVMKPWYRHFTGTIEKIDKNKYISRANYTIENDTIHIADLPIGVWTDNYKEFLSNLIAQGAQDKKDAKRNSKKEVPKRGSKEAPKRGSKNAKFLAKKSQKSSTAKVAKKNPIGSSIKSYTEDCTDIRISFTIIFYPGQLRKYVKNETLEKYLKLVTPLNLTNMHLFDANGKIRKYESYGSILKNFAKVRLELYQTRKDYLLGKWAKEIDMLNWQLKFVEGVIAEEIIVFKKQTAEVIAQLEKLKFPKFITEKKIASYDYLSRDIMKFTEDEVEKLRKKIKEKKKEIATLEAKTPTQIWDEELEDFIQAYDKWEACEDAEYDSLMAGRRRTKRKPSMKAIEV